MFHYSCFKLSTDTVAAKKIELKTSKLESLQKIYQDLQKRLLDMQNELQTIKNTLPPQNQSTPLSNLAQHLLQNETTPQADQIEEIDEEDIANFTDLADY